MIKEREIKKEVIDLPPLDLNRFDYFSVQVVSVVIPSCVTEEFKSEQSPSSITTSDVPMLVPLTKVSHSQVFSLEQEVTNSANATVKLRIEIFFIFKFLSFN